VAQPLRRSWWWCRIHIMVDCSRGKPGVLMACVMLGSPAAGGASHGSVKLAMRVARGAGGGRLCDGMPSGARCWGFEAERWEFC